MYHTGKAATATCVAVLTAAIAGGAHAQLGDVMLNGQYGWEDGTGTILNSVGEVNNPTNLLDSRFAVEGDHVLRVSNSDNFNPRPEAHVVYVEGLEHGDVVEFSAWLYDDGGETTGRSRPWGHYAYSNDITNNVGSAGGPNQFTSGIGWEQITHTWTFDEGDPQNPRDTLVIEIRLYNQPGVEVPPNPYLFYVDDINVNVYCATNPALRISFPDGSFVEGPTGTPGPDCAPCDQFTSRDYGWEDGDGMVLGSFGNLAFWENIDSSEGPVNSGTRALRVVEQPHDGVPQAYLAFVENLQDGDEIFASAFAYDDGSAGSGQMRIWAHYGISGDLDSFAGSAGGNNTFTSGQGWEELTHNWTFDSQGGSRDALMIHMRLYDNALQGQESTEYFIDDVFVEVCSQNVTGINIITPEDIIIPPPPPPVDPCDQLDDLIGELGSPLVEGGYGWEDGEATVFGTFVPFGACFDDPWAGDNLQHENIDATGGLVHTGDRALKLTENPHCGSTPQAFVAFVENLEDGDTIHGRFFAYDDTPGEPPRVRIWAHYANSGEPLSFRGSAGGNETYTSGIGWEELCHTWEFDAAPDHPSGPRDALMIHVRVFSTPSQCLDPEAPNCSTDYFIDDIEVAAWSANPNATITYPDGTTFGDGPGVGCLADMNDSGDIGQFELFSILGAWGTADSVIDINEDGIVDGGDLGIVLASWGSCDNFLPWQAGNIDLVLEQQSASLSETEYRLYVDLGNQVDTVVNVYDANINFPNGFIASSSAVTIGSLPAPSAIETDPNFNSTAFNNGTGVGMDAGWYNSAPTTAHGQPDQDGRVLIALFTVDETAGEAAPSGSLSVTYEDADGRAIQGTAQFELAVDDCPGDLNGDTVVNVDDLLIVLNNWGACPGGTPGCPGDANEDAVVNVDDLLIVLNNWGACP